MIGASISGNIYRDCFRKQKREAVENDRKASMKNTIGRYVQGLGQHLQLQLLSIDDDLEIVTF